jgi:hypothetical protein
MPRGVDGGDFLGSKMAVKKSKDAEQGNQQ